MRYTNILQQSKVSGNPDVIANVANMIFGLPADKASAEVKTESLNLLKETIKQQPQTTESIVNNAKILNQVKDVWEKFR